LKDHHSSIEQTANLVEGAKKYALEKVGKEKKDLLAIIR
jgi:hypothetical protein